MGGRDLNTRQLTGMDRTYWFELGQFHTGERPVSQQPGVRLYDGEEKVSYL